MKTKTTIDAYLDLNIRVGTGIQTRHPYLTCDTFYSKLIGEVHNLRRYTVLHPTWCYDLLLTVCNKVTRKLSDKAKYSLLLGETSKQLTVGSSDSRIHFP